MRFFPVQGRALLANGYLIVPIKPREKRPALSNWQRARLGAVDLSTYPNCGVGVLCGQGAHPIAAFDIDTNNAELVRRFADWCHDVLGMTCERVGNAPRVLLPYRAAEDGWAKVVAPYEDLFGDQHKLEVLGHGQQFVAYHIHPDTGRPYQWTDMLGGLEHVRADELPVVTAEQINEALTVFGRLAEELGMQRVSKAGGSDTPAAPKERTPAADEDYFGRVNEAALENLDAWVPVLFPSAREYNGGYRVSSVDLGRDLEEDLGLSPSGIVDFGVADMGDPRAGKRTAIDVVLEWGIHCFEDALDAPMTPFEAATWLCERLDKPREAFGFGLRRQREKDAERSARRMEQKALIDKIKACDDSIDLIEGVCVAARAVIHAMPALRGEIAAEIKARYKAITGFTMSHAELSKALKEPTQPTVKAKRPLTEFGNAERMLDRYGKGLMYVPEMNTWHAWTGVYWRKTSDVEIEHYAKETIRALVSEADEHADPAEFFKFCTISQQAKMVRNMVALAASDPRVVVPARELDRHWYYLGAQNGVIDLRTGDLLAPDPSLHITRCCACEYVPSAKGELFRKAVSDALMADADMIGYLQRLVGYAATGNPVEDVMAIPFGGGANGKSTIFGAIREAFGSYGAAADPTTFVSDGKGGGNAGGAREDLLRLRGVRFLYVNEPDDGSELREGSVKSMAGGDAITARGLYTKESVEFLPTWLTVMPTNHKPIVKSNDEGIWRRLHMIPFYRNMSKDPTIVKDPTFKLRVREDLEGVLAWIIEGVRMYQKDGLKRAGAVKRESEQYRHDMDLLSEWLEECCEIAPHLEVQSSALWESWEGFAKRRGLINYVKNSVALGRKLEQRFPSKKDGRGCRMRKGLRLRDYGELFE